MADEHQIPQEENVGEEDAILGIKREVGEPEADADLGVQGPMEIDADAINSEQNASSDGAPAGPIINIDEPSPTPTIGLNTSPPSPSPSNWRVGKSIPQLMEYILEHDDVTRKDVTFFVGEGEELEEISAHKQILSFVSPVFEHVLFGHPDVQNIVGQLNIAMPDVKPITFRLLLRYIYVRKLKVESKYAFDLLKLSTRFELPDLAAKCRTKLRTEICVKNAAEIMASALDINEPRLKELALNYIHQNAKMVLSTQGFLDLPREALREVFDHDNLNADEVLVFHSAVSWAQNWIRKRAGSDDIKISGEDILNELQDVIYCIRFPLMTPQEFTVHVAKRGILKQDDVISIFFYFNSPRDMNSDSDPLPFSKEKRSRGTTVAPATSSSEDTPIPTRRLTATDPLGGATSSTTTIEIVEPEIDIVGGDGSQQSHAVSSESRGEESGPCEPPRKTMRIENDGICLNQSETVDVERIETSPSPPVSDEQEEIQGSSVEIDMNMDMSGCESPEPIASTSTGFITPQRRLTNTVSDADVQSDHSESRISINGDDENSPRKIRKDTLLNELQEAYIQENLNETDTGNTLSNFFQRIMIITMNAENNLEEMTAICESDPIVINHCSTFMLSIPYLKEFSVNYLHNSKSVKGLKSYLQSLNLASSLLFFKVVIDDVDDLCALWMSEINVCIQVNGLNILKVDHESKSLTISRIKQSSESIMEGLMLSAGLRKIHLEEIKIDSLDLIPTDDLEVMTLRKVTGIKNRAEFIRKCEKLEEFSCCSMGDETIDLGIDFGFLTRPGRTRLRRLALGKAKLHCSNPLKKLDNPLEELYLDNCTLTSELLEAFPLIFPNLKKIKVCRNVTPKLLLKIFEIETIEWIGIWDLPIRQINPNTPRKKGKRKSAFSPEDQDVADRVKATLDDVDFGNDSSWINSNTEQTIILQNINTRIDEMNSQDSQQQSQQGTQSTASQQQFRQRIQFHAQQANNPLTHDHERWVGRRLKGSAKFEEFTRLDYKQFDWRMFYSDYHLFHKMNR